MILSHSTGIYKLLHWCNQSIIIFPFISTTGLLTYPFTLRPKLLKALHVSLLHTLCIGRQGYYPRHQV